MRSLIFSILIFFSIVIKAQDKPELNKLIFDGEYREAIKRGKELLEIEPDNASFYYTTALAYRNLNKFSNANKYFKKSAELDTVNLKYINAYAENLYVLGFYKKAIVKLEHVLLKDSDNFFALNKLAKIYIKIKKYEKALDLYIKLIQTDLTNTFYYGQAGYCSLKLKETKNALEYYKKAYQIDSTNIKNIKQLSNFYLRTKKNDKSLEISNQGINVDSTISDFYRLKAMAYFSKNHNYKAVPEFYKVFELGDSTLELSKYLGIALFHTFKFNKAYKCLYDVYQADSTIYEVTLYLGRSCYELKKYDKSLFYLDKTLKLLEPSKYLLTNIYDDKAKSYYGNEQYSASLEMYNKKFNILKYREVNDYYYIAILYDKMNKRKKALENYDKYANSVKDNLVNPTENKQYQYVLKRIKRIKEDLHFEGN